MKTYFCSLFDYKDGNLYWKVSRSSRIKVGQLAGTFPKDKRPRIYVKPKTWLTHRIIFAMHHGYMPKYIDHIDGNTLNNKIENLREATFSENCQNTGLRKDNKSGIKGIHWNKQRKKWDATICKNKTKIFVGRFKDIEQAKLAINKKRQELHGNFARFY